MPGDMRLRLRDVLAQLSERDSVVPAEPMRLRVPLIMISGFSPVQTSLAVRRQPQHGRSSQQPTRHPPPHKPTRLLRASPLGPKREPSPLGCRRELRRCSGAGPKSPFRHLLTTPGSARWASCLGTSSPRRAACAGRGRKRTAATRARASPA